MDNLAAHDREVAAQALWEVAALHRPGLLTGMCITCRRNQPWPCPTARAVALTETEETTDD